MSEQENDQARFSAALKRLDGDWDLLCEMAAITAPDCPDVIRQIECDLGEGICDSAARNLHKLKGMLSTFDCDGAVLEIQELIDLARRAQLDDLRKGFQVSRKPIDELVEEIRQLIR